MNDQFSSHFQWVFYFSDGLTTRKRAYYNTRNVIETYQRNKYIEIFFVSEICIKINSYSLLFQKTPPTPMPPRTMDANQQQQQNDGNGQSSSAAEIGNMQAGGEFNTWRQQVSLFSLPIQQLICLIFYSTTKMNT